jgi:leader peptidase (prepilin peptidase) / N-methyltransferase
MVGARLPLTAYRLAVPYGVPPRPACGSCDRPFASWLRPECSCRLGPRTLAMLSAGALAGLAAGVAVESHPSASRAEAGLLLAVLLLVALVGVLLAAVDLAVLRLPDVLVLPTGAAVAALVAIAAAVVPDRTVVVRALAAAGLLGGGYALLALLPRSALGFGDVKFATVLGVPLGWLGWPAVLLGAVLPVVLGGLVTLALLATGRIRRDTPVPFGPALLAGTLLAAALSPSG